ncbi:MAG: transglycosylase SLT domain-containing protein [Bradymonadaceae bacterium]|nr:transglycosylase SLT domain-containing protein [Lujinxingiaceae bacterium]
MWTIGALSCLTLAVFVTVPELSAQRLDASPKSGGANGALGASQLGGERMELALNLTSAHALATTSLLKSSRTANQVALCAFGEATLVLARDTAFGGERLRAEEMLRALLDEGKGCARSDSEQSARALQDRARLQLGNLLISEGRPDDALAVLEAISANTPVNDYVLWLRANALEAAARPAEAAEHFAKIHAIGTSPLHWRARGRQAKALIEAEKWKEALPVLTQMVELFPDYPRRHAALYYRGLALDKLGKHAQAAEAYQRAWFEFPFKAEGELAKARLDAYALEGIKPVPIARERLLASYRQLRVDKHWPLAHKLLTALGEAHKSESGITAFENEVLLEIALNAHYSHNHEDAVYYFDKARKIYESASREGFNARTMYRFQSFSLARLERFDEALGALETLNKGASLNTRLTAYAAFYEEHGQYKHALQIYDKLYSAGQKRGWHFSYLLYKSGKFDSAYDNFVKLAERSGGERRAKYLYWAGRALERGGNDADAREIFDEVARAYTSSYYGIQATNRSMDIVQRGAANAPMLVEAKGMLQSAEEAFQAFDEAATMFASATTVAASDPRTLPLDERYDAATHTDAGFSPYQFVATPHACAIDTLLGTESCATPRVVRPHSQWPMTPAFSPELLAGTAAPQSATRRGKYDEVVVDDDEADGSGGTSPSEGDALTPVKKVKFAKQAPRVRYNTDARIYWHGRNESDIAFVRHRQGDMLGVLPSQLKAYDEDDYVGGVYRAVAAVGDLFPELVRAQWLWEAGMGTEARRATRDVALELRGLSQRGRPGARPHALEFDRWAYYIDNRRQKSALWGMSSSEKRFPVPADAAASRKLLERQQAIVERRRDFEPALIEAFMEVGEYHLVRRHALNRGGWSRQDPRGDTRRSWMQAYPRAYPEIVIPEAIKRNVNPYMIWALMLVESSFNPDSLSRADAMGLLQVIPRTGLKVAAMFGDADFGPFDLLEDEAAIRQGVFYFSRLVQKFHGQELLSFAGYNGGPHRVGAWLEARGRDIPLDEFIEEIPFNEARGYAKKVLRFVGVYMRIYEGVDHLYVGQNLRQDYLEQPDF